MVDLAVVDSHRVGLQLDLQGAVKVFGGVSLCVLMIPPDHVIETEGPETTPAVPDLLLEVLWSLDHLVQEALLAVHRQLEVVAPVLGLLDDLRARLDLE